jgi:hypothetical protein
MGVGSGPGVGRGKGLQRLSRSPNPGYPDLRFTHLSGKKKKDLLIKVVKHIEAIPAFNCLPFDGKGLGRK